MNTGIPLSPFVPWPRNQTLVLASRSPRRAELLQVAGIPHEVVPAGEVEADLAARLQEERTLPTRYAELLADAKARDVSRSMPGRLVLGADTVVVLEGKILEKPVDQEDAFRLLSLLSGKTHTVISAVVLVGGPAGFGLAAHELTEVEFLELPAAAIRQYIATGEPMDKAGAYGIQGYGAMMVKGVHGCYFNVMGLPLARLGILMRQVLAPFA
jgi:septum formation protein